MKIWGKDLNLVVKELYISKILNQLYNQLISTKYTLIQLNKSKYFINFRYSKKFRKENEKLEKICNELGLLVSFLKAQLTNQNVTKIGMVTGCTDLNCMSFSFLKQ
jgi:hypothetical protein